MKFAPDPFAWGWPEMLAPLAWLKVGALKPFAVMASAPWGPPALGFSLFYAVTAGSFFQFAGLCVSHGVAIGMGAAGAYVGFRRQADAGLEKLDRERAAFEKEMADERLHDEIARDKLRAAARAEALTITAEAEARAFTIREQAERGSTLVQLREAEEKIADNQQRITTLEAQLNTSLARIFELGKNLSSAAAQGLGARTWGVVQGGGDAVSTSP